MDWYRLLPKYWTQNYPTSDAWDKELNEALDRYSIRNANGYTAMVGPFEVWIANYPYASGSLYSFKESYKFLPKVATRIRLMKAVDLARESSEAEFLNDVARIKVRGGGQMV